MEFTPEDTERLVELMRWRRDVRHFRRDPIDEGSIAILQQAMALAPSVGNSRPWRVVRVDSLPIREKIVENFCSANRKAARIYDTERAEKYMKLKLAGLQEAPLQLAVFTDQNPAAGHGLGRQTMAETLNYSTVSAVHQLWLAARTMNIGVGWVSILDDKEINRILNVEPEWQLTAYLCIGYPQELSDEPELQRKGWQASEEADWLLR